MVLLYAKFTLGVKAVESQCDDEDIVLLHNDLFFKSPARMSFWVTEYRNIKKTKW